MTQKSSRIVKNLIDISAEIAIIRVGLLSVVLLIAGTFAALAHDDAQWIMESPEYAWCCGPEDCRILEVTEVEQMSDGKWFVNGKAVNNIYKVPMDLPGDGYNRYWACFQNPNQPNEYPNCLFIPQGMF